MAPRPLTTPRKEPRQERARATVDAILSATAHVLVKEGYDRASTNRIALEAGVSVGSLYQYFPSKEALVAALIERHSIDMVSYLEERAARHPPNAPLRDMVRDVVHAMVEAHRVDPKLHRVLMEQVPRVGALKRLTEMDDKALLLIRAFLETRRAEIRPKNLKLAAFLLSSLVEAVTHGAVLLHPEYLVDQGLVEETTEVICRYLLD
ncbi:MAG: TetR/AcrR family transcriptional regulator [Polyangiaceae bacterium]|jgi:AcrR family transcriptional regulator